MGILGITLIVIGLALLCCAFLFRTSSDRPVDEGEQEALEGSGEPNREGKKEPPEGSLG